MKKYLQLKEEIEGYTDVLETLKAVEKTASARLPRLRETQRLFVEQEKRSHELASKLLRLRELHSHTWVIAGRGPVLGLLFTGDKGLTGGLWKNLIDQAAFSGITQWIVIGKKGERLLSNSNQILARYSAEDLYRQGIETVANELVTRFRKTPFSSFSVLYPEYQSIAEQTPVLREILPFKRPATEEEQVFSEGLPVFEPSYQRVLHMALETAFRTSLRRVWADFLLSEAAARTITAEHAVENARRAKERMEHAYTLNRRRFLTQRQLESYVVHRTV